MADHHDNDWLIGPGLALDTTRSFLVATELFGNGIRPRPATRPSRITGPDSPRHHSRQRRGRPPPAGGRAARHPPGGGDRVLDGGGAGVPMGGELSRFMDRIVALAGTARCWPHGKVRLGRDRRDLERHRLPAAATWPRQARPRSLRPDLGRLADLAGVVARRAVEGSHLAAGDSYESVVATRRHVHRLDANDLILQATWRGTTWAPRGIPGASSARSARSARESSTCRSRPTCTSRVRCPRRRGPSAGSSRADPLGLGARRRRRRRRGRQAVVNADRDVLRRLVAVTGRAIVAPGFGSGRRRERRSAELRAVVKMLFDPRDPRHRPDSTNPCRIHRRVPAGGPITVQAGPPHAAAAASAMMAHQREAHPRRAASAVCRGIRISAVLAAQPLQRPDDAHLVALQTDQRPRRVPEPGKVQRVRRPGAVSAAPHDVERQQGDDRRSSRPRVHDAELGHGPRSPRTARSTGDPPGSRLATRRRCGGGWSIGSSVRRKMPMKAEHQPWTRLRMRAAHVLVDPYRSSGSKCTAP